MRPFFLTIGFCIVTVQFIYMSDCEQWLMFAEMIFPINNFATSTSNFRKSNTLNKSALQAIHEAIV
jgi:hypothetical protein